jgi:hypothetical protein
MQYFMSTFTGAPNVLDPNSIYDMIDMTVKAQICFPGSRASREDYDSQDGNWQLISSPGTLQVRTKTEIGPTAETMPNDFSFGIWFILGTTF